MNEVHREGDVSLYAYAGAEDAVELRESTSHGDVVRYTTADAESLKRIEGGLSINEICRRYADRAGVDFETAAAAVLDALEAPREADSD